MVFLHILGASIAVVGLILFIQYQMKGAKGEASQMQVWKINLSGPAPLVLVVVGVLIAVFPFTTFFRNPEDPSPPSTLPPEAQVSTTVVQPGETTLTTLVPEIGLPLTPASYEVVFDAACGEDTIVWEQPDFDLVLGWWISIESYTLDTDELFSSFEIDTGADDLTFDNFNALCELDFVTDTPLLYWIWIYAYNEAGYSEPLFVEYLDE